ncbi:hypothetical protein DFH08DRAFT_810072 [Mycena albidolilacea]|uniref:Uncharacterized protein n=1 Tax=Mycena albidolilacea TaxID=1033008 RepID=A0AAD6ZYW1_9AGAR|nr:hypothetical protein DFH08DRAFT_810072 [Mycena albidolilacea]
MAAVDLAPSGLGADPTAQRPGRQCTALKRSESASSCVERAPHRGGELGREWEREGQRARESEPRKKRANVTPHRGPVRVTYGTSTRGGGSPRWEAQPQPDKYEVGTPMGDQKNAACQMLALVAGAAADDEEERRIKLSGAASVRRAEVTPLWASSRSIRKERARTHRMEVVAQRNFNSTAAHASSVETLTRWTYGGGGLRQGCNGIDKWDGAATHDQTAARRFRGNGVEMRCWGHLEEGPGVSGRAEQRRE